MKLKLGKEGKHLKHAVQCALRSRVKNTALDFQLHSVANRGPTAYSFYRGSRIPKQKLYNSLISVLVYLSRMKLEMT